MAKYLIFKLSEYYDNRDYRYAKHVKEMFKEVCKNTFTLEKLRQYISDHIFPEIVRAYYVQSYNQRIHNHADVFDIENWVCSTLSREIKNTV